MLFSFACEAAGAAKHPAFPAPSAFEGQRQAKLGRDSPREGGVVAILRDAAFRPLVRMRSQQMVTDTEAADPHGEEAPRAVSNHEAWEVQPKKSGDTFPRRPLHLIQQNDRETSAHFPKFVLHRSTHLHELRKVMGTSKLFDSSTALSI